MIGCDWSSDVCSSDLRIWVILLSTGHIGTGFCYRLYPSGQASACHFGSERSSLPNLAKLVRIFDSRQSFSDYSCHRSTSAFHRCRVYLSFKFHLITRNEIQYETDWGYSNALWSSPLLRQRQSATYVKLLARSVHTEQLPSTTPVRPVCLSPHIKGYVLK